MHATRTARRRLAAAVPLALLVLALAAPAAFAQQEVAVTGTVTNATVEEPVADAPVRVAFFDAQGQATVSDTTTDADGAFSVVPPAGATGYQVAVDHDGAEFRGIATTLLPGQPSVATIQVWDTTTDPADVTTASWVVWIDEDPEGAGWNVQETFGWTNSGDTAYVGEDGATVTVPLPPGAGNVQFLDTFLEYQGDVVDGVYVSSAPIVPGDSTGTIFSTSPELPTLDLQASFDVQVFELYVPMGLQAQAQGLRLAGTQTDRGVTYQVYTSDALVAGDALQVSFAQVDVAEGETDATTYLLIAIAVLALAAALFFFFRGRRRSRPAPKAGQKNGPKKARPAQPQKAPAPRPAGATANGHRTERPAAEVEDDDEVQLLIDEIAALDLSFEKGLMDERTYRRLRVSAKDRLLLAQEARSGTGGTR